MPRWQTLLASTLLLIACSAFLVGLHYEAKTADEEAYQAEIRAEIAEIQARTPPVPPDWLR